MNQLFPKPGIDSALRLPERTRLSSPKAESRAAAVCAPEATNNAGSSLIRRFRTTEIRLHWSIAIPFMVCYATGFILKFFYNLHSEGISRDVLSWLHRVAGAGLIVFPLLTALRDRKEYRTHLQNVKQAWTWTLDDVKWLLLMGAAAVNPKIRLPEQRKFNAAEKVNFAAVMCTYPLFIITGLMLWMPGLKFLSWIGHVGMAFAVTPLMLGHIYMAIINPGTRIGLGGMISGYVDRQWAKHHYQTWYRESFEEDAGAGHGEDLTPPQNQPTILCGSCRAPHVLASWSHLLEKVHEARPLACPACGADSNIVSVVVEPRELNSILRSLERASLSSAPPRKPPAKPPAWIL